MIYCDVQTPVGVAFLAGEQDRLSLLYLGSDRNQLLRIAQSDTSEVQFEYQESAFQEARFAVQQFFHQHPIPVEMQLHGSEFDQRVWNYLQTIPLGETRTYSAVAAGIGQPSAVRAVANACGRNPISLLIPCHRVIGADQKLRGYRWGLPIKKQLLEMEGVQLPSTFESSALPTAI